MIKIVNNNKKDLLKSLSCHCSQSMDCSETVPLTVSCMCLDTSISLEMGSGEYVGVEIRVQ